MKRTQYVIECLLEQFEVINDVAIFNEGLDESYSFVDVGSLFENLRPSDVLYKCNLSLYLDEHMRFTKRMIDAHQWVDYGDRLWPIEAQLLINEIEEAIKYVDPFYDDIFKAWFYWDDMSFTQGPFPTPLECYRNAYHKSYETTNR